MIVSKVIELTNKYPISYDEKDEEIIKRMLKDVDIASATQKLERAVASRKLIPRARNQELSEVEKDIQQRFSGIKFNRIVNHLITARYFGYSCFEIIYNEDFTIETLIPIPFDFITYDFKENKWKLKIGSETIELNKQKFLLAIHKWDPKNAKGKSIFDCCNKTFLNKELYQRQLTSISQKYGDIIVIYPYDVNMKEEEREELRKSVENIGTAKSIGAPVDFNEEFDLKKNIDFIKLSDLDPSIYTELEKIEKEKIVQNILGSTLTMDNGGGTGSYSLGEVHRQGFEEVVEEICRFVSDSLYQLIELDSSFFGYNPKDFYWELEKVVTQEEQSEIEKKQQEFLGIKLDNINKLATAGYEFNDKYLGEYLGVDYKNILKKKTIAPVIEFSEDEDKKLFNTFESATLFNEYIIKRIDEFTKNIHNQILEQISKIKEGTDFSLNLDLSILEDDLIISFIKGFTNNKSITYGEVINEFDPFKMKFDEAIKSFLDKTPILYDEIEEITQLVRSNFVWLKKSTDLEATTRLFDNMKKSMEEGTTFKQWLKDCEETINKLGLGEQGYYLENVYRTNMMTEYSIGNYKQQMECIEDYPYWEYCAIEDNRTSTICKNLDGVVKRFDDPFWSAYYPPNHYQCRSSVISRSKEEIKKFNLKVSKKEIDIDVKSFKGNPAEIYWSNIKNNAQTKQGSFKWE